MVFPFSKPRFFNLSISLMLHSYTIFRVCFCMDKKTSCNELLLAIIRWCSCWTLELIPQSARAAGAGPSAALGLVMATSSLDLAYIFFPPCFTENQGGICICSATRQKKKLRGDRFGFCPSKPLSSPNLTHSPLLCLPSLCSGGTLRLPYFVKVPGCQHFSRRLPDGGGKV